MSVIILYKFSWLCEQPFHCMMHVLLCQEGGEREVIIWLRWRWRTRNLWKWGVTRLHLSLIYCSWLSWQVRGQPETGSSDDVWTAVSQVENGNVLKWTCSRTDLFVVSSSRCLFSYRFDTYSTVYKCETSHWLKTSSDMSAIVA